MSDLPEGSYSPRTAHCQALALGIEFCGCPWSFSPSTMFEATGKRVRGLPLEGLEKPS